MIPSSQHPGAPLLAVENLSVAFPTSRGTVHALNKVSFYLDAGKTLGIVGESGCGKSLLCRCLLRLLPLSAVVSEKARIVFDEIDLLSLNEKELCKIRGRKISMVYQDPTQALSPAMRIGDQLAEVYHYHEGLDKKAALLIQPQDLIDRRAGIQSERDFDARASRLHWLREIVFRGFGDRRRHFAQGNRS